MYKLIFDSDGLIKLVKARIIHEVCEKFNCLVTSEVFKETVIEGKKRLYEDAFTIEKLIKQNKIKIKKSDKLKIENLGKGESSTLQLSKKINAMVVSDDSTFISYLRDNSVPFMTPTNLITRLYKLNYINKTKALDALEKIKPFIKKEIYDKTKNKLSEKV